MLYANKHLIFVGMMFASMTVATGGLEASELQDAVEPRQGCPVGSPEAPLSASEGINLSADRIAQFVAK